MELSIHQIDAFADALFAGNPAAVMEVPTWPTDELLRLIAAENNCAETAFYSRVLPLHAPPAPSGLPAYHLRWFTPTVEVDLCGHATLATGALLLDDVDRDAPAVALYSRSGWLLARRGAPGTVTIDLPATLPAEGEVDRSARDALRVEPKEALLGRDQIYVLADAEQVRTIDPDLRALGELPVRGVIVTAAGGADADYVARFFGARVGGGEDPVTGSAHAQCAPLWAERLNKDTLLARQLSPRGGTLTCEVVGDRVALTGTYHRYLAGTVTIPEWA